MSIRLLTTIGSLLRIACLLILASVAARGAIYVTINTTPTTGGAFAAGVWTPRLRLRGST